MKVTILEEKIDEAQGLFSEVEIHAFEVAQEFEEQRARVGILSRNIVRSVVKLGEMHQRMTDACNEEVHSIVRSMIEKAKLEKKSQAEIKDLKKEADGRPQWHWEELKSARDHNEWLLRELHQACSQLQGEGPSNQYEERIQ